MVNDTIADALARLQNGIMREKKEIKVSKTKIVGDILEILKREAMIVDYVEDGTYYVVTPRYRQNGEAIVAHFTRISRPGQRIYVGSSEIIPIMNGRGISIISTSKGLMAGAVAKSKELGGEHICNIW